MRAVGAVTVSAESTENVNAKSNEASPGLVVGAGGSVPTADVRGSASAFVADGANIMAGSLNVTVQGTDTAATDAEAFGTGFVAAITSDAEADINVDTEAYVGAATITSSGAATVAATTSDTATANSGHFPQNLLQAFFGTGGSGFVAFAAGSIKASGSIESQTKAHLDGAVVTAGGGVGVAANATAQATSGTFALILGSIFAGQSNTSDATVTPGVFAWINNAVLAASGNVSVTPTPRRPRRPAAPATPWVS